MFTFWHPLGQLRAAWFGCLVMRESEEPDEICPGAGRRGEEAAARRWATTTRGPGTEALAEKGTRRPKWFRTSSESPDVSPDSDQFNLPSPGSPGLLYYTLHFAIAEFFSRRTRNGIVHSRTLAILRDLDAETAPKPQASPLASIHFLSCK